MQEATALRVRRPLHVPVAGVDRPDLAGVVVCEQGAVVEGQGALHRAAGVDLPAHLAGLRIEGEDVARLAAEDDLAIVDEG